MSLGQINEGAELKDEVLLALSREEPAHFAILVDRYQEAFLRTAERVVRRRQDAEDVVQEAFLKIYKNSHRFVKQENIEFKSWAYRVVLNTAFTHYQRAKRRYLGEDAESEETLEAIPEHTAPGSDVELRLMVEHVLRDVPDDLASVLRKHYIEDKAYETIAAEEGTTVAAIKMKLYRARKAAQKLFQSGEGSKKHEGVSPSTTKL
jgi:RNA polymerase sigma factor (sigma-70 family)